MNTNIKLNAVHLDSGDAINGVSNQKVARSVGKVKAMKPNMNLLLDMQHPLRISWDGEGVKMYYVTDTTKIPSAIADVPKVTTYYTSEHSPVINPDIKWFSFYNNPYNTTLTKIKIEGGRGLVDLHRAFQMFSPEPTEEQISTFPKVEIDLSNLDVSNVTTLMTFAQIFPNAISFGDLSNWNVSKVTAMNSMFSRCYELQSVGDLSNWDVSKVVVMNLTFNQCYELQSVGDLSNWDVSKVTTMKWMFDSCYKLTSVGDLSNWDVSKVTNLSAMFQCCYKLQSVGDLSNWDTSNVTTMSGMFNKCYELTSVGNLSNWDTSNVTDMNIMFQYCHELVSVGDLSNWDVSKVTNMRYMFAYMENLDSLNLYGWDTTNADCTHMFTFQDGTDDGLHPHKKLTSLTLGPNFFNSTKTTSFDFNGCKAWTRESMVESLYTNQAGRDTTKVKEIVLHPDAYDRLTEEDRTQITSLGFTLTRFVI